MKVLENSLSSTLVTVSNIETLNNHGATPDIETPIDYEPGPGLDVNAHLLLKIFVRSTIKSPDRVLHVIQVRLKTQRVNYWWKRVDWID